MRISGPSWSRQSYLPGTRRRRHAMTSWRECCRDRLTPQMNERGHGFHLECRIFRRYALANTGVSAETRRAMSEMNRGRNRAWFTHGNSGQGMPVLGHCTSCTSRSGSRAALALSSRARWRPGAGWDAAGLKLGGGVPWSPSAATQQYYSERDPRGAVFASKRPIRLDEELSPLSRGERTLEPLRLEQKPSHVVSFSSTADVHDGGSLCERPARGWSECAQLGAGDKSGRRR
ncbi:hypothetical protein OH76DRAFT_695756 [Lentinus brumalis]|uniref:Uncharacterized protein n=1 Tax=Lentinus brumalis TaxID=2498619 RepID=A0A371D676_9APHY|nr:hypothetical protein OH76DRAFT_695756 [Polyporus brumalis]